MGPWGEDHWTDKGVKTHSFSKLCTAMPRLARMLLRATCATEASSSFTETAVSLPFRETEGVKGACADWEEGPAVLSNCWR